MLMYGSSFWRETLRPRAFRMVPIDAAVIPLPIEETTPPVTKTYFGTGTLFYAGAGPSASRFFRQPCVSCVRLAVLVRAECLRRSNLGKAVYPYGLIGNCETAALVATSGSVDWFCYPRFDSPSIFAAILDRQRGGSFRVSPVNPVPTGEQAYLRDTNILTTTFHRSEGTLVVTDFMPCFTEGERFLSLKRICRGLEARGGPVEVECVLDPAPAYGRARTSFAEREGIVIASGGAQEVILSSTVALNGMVEEVEGRPRYVFRFTVQPGPQVWVTLGFGEHYFALGRKFPSSSDATELAERTRAFWVGWLDQCLYHGPFQDAVRRSALVIKLLTYAPTGALCAAPTTSIPEDPGGDRNWDYRYCWLRDASYGIAALFRTGFEQEAVDFINWIRDRAYDHDFAMQILYRVDGDPHLPEQYLEHLAGFEGARPVRIGNRAAGQRQPQELRTEIEVRSWNPKIGAFTQAYDDECLDAAVLQMPVLGFLPATDPRMRATIETLSQRLLNGPYVRRYDCKDDQGYLSAAFLLCSFWYVDGLIGMNRLDAAQRQLAQPIALSSPLGLLAEGNDPVSRAPPANFPQAYRHLGGIDSAVRLERARAAEQAAARV